MAKKKNSGLKYLLIILGILVAVLIIARLAGWVGGPKVTQVSTDRVEKRTVEETVSASGKVQPELEVKLSSEVSGEIVELLIKEGDVVGKGQLLCKIRPDILQSGYDRAVASLNAQRATLAATEQQFKQAQAAFQNSEAAFKRIDELYKRKVISASEYDQALSDYESARANLEAQRQNVLGSRYGIDQSQAAVKEAGDNLARTSIYAPVDGVVSLLEVELGERVVGTAQMAGTEIMRIANMSSMEVNVDVNESDINRVALSNSADIEIDAFRGRIFKGVVTEIGSSSKSNASATVSSTDQVTNFNVKVRILTESYQDLLNEDRDNPSPFRPGLSATVDIRTKSDNGLAVPIQAVTTRQATKTAGSEESDKNAPTNEAKEFVFVYDGTKVDQVEVKTGIQDDTYIRVLSGLTEGQEVVTRPFNAITTTLKDGDLVEKVSKEKLY